MNIFKSIIIILGTLAITSGSTLAFFKSQAIVADNTFTSGVLDIKINGQASIPGFSVSGAVPGDKKDGWFAVDNCGLNQHNKRICSNGKGTLTAKKMTLSAKLKDGANARLFDKLQIKIETDRNFPDVYPDVSNTGSLRQGPYPKQLVYEGSLSGLTEKNLLLSPYWETLEPERWQIVYYEVTLPEDTDESYQNLSAIFDFIVDARTD